MTDVSSTYNLRQRNKRKRGGVCVPNDGTVVASQRNNTGNAVASQHSNTDNLRERFAADEAFEREDPLNPMPLVPQEQLVEMAKRHGVEICGPLAIHTDTKIINDWNNLAPEERVVAYYLYRASIPFNDIYSKQMHRYALAITRLFGYVYEKTANDHTKFAEQIRTYYVFLLANRCQYLLILHKNNKRTPANLNLNEITPESLTAFLESNNYGRPYKYLFPHIFDSSVDPTICVDGSIEESACGIYSPDFTSELYETVPPAIQEGVNNYYSVGKTQYDEDMAVAAKYCSDGHCAREFTIAARWVYTAFEYAVKHPEYFDSHFTHSLRYLHEYFTTGDESAFKRHSVEWLKTTARINYLLGLIEVYDDPKQRVGSAVGEVTINTVDMSVCNQLLPEIEKLLPIAQRTSRTNMNYSISRKLFASGANGPHCNIAAYCLPNYDDIRSTHGSKQIAYPTAQSLSVKLFPEETLTMTELPHVAELIRKHDPKQELSNDIWDIHVLLHETLGHGAGRLTTHTFEEGDPLTINNKTYMIGDTIPMTTELVQVFFPTDSGALEEMRADINAFYTSIVGYDKLLAMDLFKKWHDKIGETNFKYLLLTEAANTGIYRLRAQPKEGFGAVTGAHARGNVVITNWLLAHGGFTVREVPVYVRGRKFLVIRTHFTNTSRALLALEQLCIHVNDIRSTGNGVACRALFDKYLNYPMTIGQMNHYMQELNRVRKALLGSVEATVEIYPHIVPVMSGEGAYGIVDAALTEMPNDLVEFFNGCNKRMLSF